MSLRVITPRVEFSAQSVQELGSQVNHKLSDDHVDDDNKREYV